MDSIKQYLNNVDLILDCIDEAVLIVDNKGTMLKYNKALARLIDVKGGSFIGKNLKDIIASGLILESPSLKCIETKRRIDMNQTYGAGNTATWTCIPVFDEKGKLVLSIGTARDVTKLVTLEKKLELSQTIISRYEDKRFTLQEDFGHGVIIYSSPEMQQVMRIGWKAATTSSPVLIWGETGVGKEMVANAIHQTSDRSGKPFVAINCASIPDELLESELFGYEEGSFTGAKKKGKTGLLEEAHKGTLFLDEIGELPMKMQSKLLRFLQEGTFNRIGGNKTKQVDVRVLSATNLAIDQLMNSKHFRQDLFYRISVIPLFVPALRERREDILPLIKYFIQQFNSRYDVNINLSPKLMQRLYNYEWPGNVRELKNVIERIAILHSSQELTEDDLELALNINRQDADIPRGIPKAKSPQERLPSSLKTAKAQFEENLIREAYKKTGSIVKTAKALGINPSTIHRKKKKGVLEIK